MTSDRLALDRAKYFQLRENRPKSISDDEDKTISDWSESDRECSPLSDFDSTFNNVDFNEKLFNNDNKSWNLNETPLPITDDNTATTQILFTNDINKEKEKSQRPLLPARRIQTKPYAQNRSKITTNLQVFSTQRNSQTISTRLYIRRETNSTTTSLNTRLTKDSRLSPDNSSQSQEDNHHNHHQRQILSPNLSQTSVPRVYEIKKNFVDDYDYGRLIDPTSTRTIQSRNRQKWGTIVHPPFPLGYQHISSGQVAQAVERLSSPSRCRDRHTPRQTPSKRYLSVEQTDALINRLTKVKTIRSTEQYWPIKGKSNTIKSLNNNFKSVGVLA